MVYIYICIGFCLSWQTYCAEVWDLLSCHPGKDALSVERPPCDSIIKCFFCNVFVEYSASAIGLLNLSS